MANIKNMMTTTTTTSPIIKMTWIQITRMTTIFTILEEKDNTE